MILSAQGIARETEGFRRTNLSYGKKPIVGYELQAILQNYGDVIAYPNRRL